MTDFLFQFYGWGWYALTTVLGVIFLVHGYAKAKNPDMMAPFWWGSRKVSFLHGAGEIAAGLAVALNVGQLYGAAFIVLVMLGALYQHLFKWKTPFWSHTGTGWEFDLLILAGALMVLLG